MDSYKSEVHNIPCDADTIFDRLTHPGRFKEALATHAGQLPEEAREHLGKVELGEESFTLQSPMGPISVGVDHEQSEPGQRVVYAAQHSPVPFNMVIHLTPTGDHDTDSQAELQLDLPFFMRKLVEQQLSDGAKKLGEAIAKLPYQAG